MSVVTSVLVISTVFVTVLDLAFSPPSVHRVRKADRCRAGLDQPKLHGFAIAVFSLFNALGRMLYGKVVDSKGFMFTATLNYASVALAFTTLWLYPSQATFLALSPIIYLDLGGWLVIAPAEVRVIASPDKITKN